MNQKKCSLLYPDINARYRTLSDVTMHDLGMDQLCKKLSAKEREQNYIQNVMARMYADPAVTHWNNWCLTPMWST
jgi:DNA mismatch repair protein MutS